jgi:hypothetical protein
LVLKASLYVYHSTLVASTLKLYYFRKCWNFQPKRIQRKEFCEENIEPSRLLYLMKWKCQKPIKYLTRGVSHYGLAIYIKKYPTTKQELWKLKYFTRPKYNLQNNPLKETKILQDIVITLL